MFGRKKREYAHQVVLYMHRICPIGEKEVVESYEKSFVNHFEEFRKHGQPANIPAAMLPISFCEKLYDFTRMCKFEEASTLDPWKEWLVTIVDILLFDEPYASSTSEMLGDEYKEKFEKLKQYYITPEINENDNPETYGDLVQRGRLKMDIINRGMERMKEIEGKQGA